MFRIIISIITITILFPCELFAQIENVIVEKYYVSDANDATDTSGGFLPLGSKTFRIFIDLAPGSKLKKIYGDSNHPLVFSSTESFFNNKADGQSFAKDFSKNRLQENTVALDSWLTLGQTTRLGAKTYFGILKSDDTDGSFIGGMNNDGGSAGIPTGLLTNADAYAGIPLTIADGLDTMNNVPLSWADYGFLDNISGVDSTIFGSVITRNEFISYNAGLQNSGVQGIDSVKNQVLVAQLTTTGDISFELNLEVEEIYGGSTRIVKYVANNNTILPDERLCPFLKYPAACGCTDPHYVEYNPVYSCNNQDSCKTIIVFGCMDSMACNFDPEANFNLQELCCYPGFCNDRDLNIVCPQLSSQKMISENFELYPNPATERITISGELPVSGEISIFIYDRFGKILSEEHLQSDDGKIYNQFDVSKFNDGIYILKIDSQVNSTSKRFIINKKNSQER